MSETTPRPAREVAPPGGAEPPAEVMLDGEWVDLRLLAREISARFVAETPAYAERYGEHAAAWCEHDCRHVLGWALSEHEGWVDLGAQVAWLARVLAARDFPLEWLARDMELAADVVAEQLPAHGDTIAARLRAVAGDVRRGAEDGAGASAPVADGRAAGGTRHETDDGAPTAGGRARGDAAADGPGAGHG